MNQNSQSGRKILRLWMIGALVAILCLIVMRPWRDTASEEELRRLKKSGLPTNPAELNAWHKPVPDAENAALVIVAATEVYQQVPGLQNRLRDLRKLPPDSLIPAEKVEVISRYLGQNKETLEVLHSITPLRESGYPTDLGKGLRGMDIAPISKARMLAELLWCEALSHAARNEPKLAARSILTGIAMANSLRNEPFLVAMLVRMTCSSIVLDALERILNASQLEEADLAQIDRTLQFEEDSLKTSLHRALVGERALALPDFYTRYDKLGENAGAGQPPVTLRGLMVDLRRAAGDREQDLVFYLNGMREFESALNDDYPEMMQKFREIQERYPGQPFERFLVSNILYPPMAAVGIKLVKSAAALRCTRYALAVERYRLTHLTLPEEAPKALTAYLAEPLRDPISHEPLEFRKLQPQGYEISSPAAANLKIHKETNTPPPITTTILR